MIRKKGFPMYCMVDGRIYDRKKSDSRLRLTVRDLNGHREAVISAPVEMTEPDLTAMELEYWTDKLSKPKTKQQQREIDEVNRQRVWRRRKTDCRRRVKALGHDTMLTGTYRALQADLALAWAHWKEFVRRVRRVLPRFSYVVAWEKQRRGAYHWHASTHNVPRELPARNGVKVKSFNLLRAIWRSVVGDLGGTVNVAKRQRSRRATQAHIAGYLSKYMLKAAESTDAGVNLWASSTCKLDKPLCEVFDREQLMEVIALAHDLCRCDGAQLCSAWIAPWGDTVFLATEPEVFSKLTTYT